MLTSTLSIVRPSVWIGCLACYNSGRLVGEWCDAEDAGEITPDDLHDTPTRHEELWCFDHEGFPTGTGEISPHTASLWGELYSEVGEEQWPAFLAWVENGSYVEDATGLPDYSSFKDRYQGTWPSLRDFLTEEVEHLQEDWPDKAIQYFDWDMYESDARFDYTVLDAPNNEVYIFTDL